MQPTNASQLYEFEFINCIRDQDAFEKKFNARLSLVFTDVQEKIYMARQGND